LFEVRSERRLLDVGHVLALPHLDHVEELQRRDDVLGLDPCPYGHVQDGQVAVRVVVVEQVDEDVRPVAAVAHLAQVTQGLFGRTCLALALGELVREAVEIPNKRLRRPVFDLILQKMMRTIAPYLMMNFPYPLCWYCGSVRMQAKL
jgi:hypothetical protein